jgi:hypothetical protein
MSNFGLRVREEQRPRDGSIAIHSAAVSMHAWTFGLPNPQLRPTLLADLGHNKSKMYIAMNRFKVIKEERKAFEDHCRKEGATNLLARRSCAPP